MARADFSEYLNVKMEDVSAAKPLPLGHFHATIQGWKVAERDYKNGEPPVVVLELTYRTTAPDDDVDITMLPANGGVGVLCTKDFRFTTPSKGKVEGGAHAQIRRFAEESLNLPVKGLAFTDVLEELKGQEVKVYNEPRPDKREEGIFYTNITKMLPPH